MRRESDSFNTLVLNFRQNGYTLGFNIKSSRLNHLSQLNKRASIANGASSGVSSCSIEYDGHNDVDMREALLDERGEDEVVKEAVRRIERLNSCETKLIYYEENEMLFYINCGEIPPMIIDLIDKISVSQRSLVLSPLTSCPPQ